MPSFVVMLRRASSTFLLESLLYLCPTCCFEEAVDTAANPFPEQEVGRVEGVAEQDVAALQRIEHVAQPGLLVAALAFSGAHGGVQQRTTA